MDKGIPGHSFAIHARKALMIFSQSVAKLHESMSKACSGIRLVYAVVQVNLYLSETLRLQIREVIKQIPVILFTWIEICVTKGRAIMIVNSLADCTS
jgi:hypothetical protein